MLVRARERSGGERNKDGLRVKIVGNAESGPAAADAANVLPSKPDEVGAGTTVSGGATDNISRDILTATELTESIAPKKTDCSLALSPI